VLLHKDAAKLLSIDGLTLTIIMKEGQLQSCEVNLCSSSTAQYSTS
jgi:hypothetical protein